MAQKCALIVDDSRTARQVLGEMLAANQLRVETAASAEEALEYLSRSRPDVIFMDHMMPGMDGLQAVRAIKNNPATATIPIMMYTSQAGELYVGQARALGAVGVLPKQIKPVEVSEVLQSLHLIEAGSRESTPPVERRREADRDMANALNARDWTDLHRWLQEMFEHHGQEMRADIETSMARVLREQAAAPPARAVGATPGAADDRTGADRCGAGRVHGPGCTWTRSSKWRAAVEQNASLMATVTSGRSLPAPTAADVVIPPGLLQSVTASGRFADFLSALEWSVNQSAGVPARRRALRRCSGWKCSSGLLDRLRTLGFTGVVQLDSHVGDFCYAPVPTVMPGLAPDDLPARALHAHRPAG